VDALGRSIYAQVFKIGRRHHAVIGMLPAPASKVGNASQRISVRSRSKMAMRELPADVTATASYQEATSRAPRAEPWPTDSRKNIQLSG
jgi:hypothetical protein